MTQAQVATALQEFVDARAAALVRLRETLAADQCPGATDPAPVPREVWPSRERYTCEEERTFSDESQVLLDGLVSYLAAVALGQAPAAHRPVEPGRG